MSRPFFKSDPRLWPLIADALPQPWPEAAVINDLVWWDDQVAVGRFARVPGRRELAKRWGWGDWQTRSMLKSEVWREDTPITPVALPSDYHRPPKKRRADVRQGQNPSHDPSRGTPQATQNPPQRVETEQQITEPRAQSLSCPSPKPTDPPAQVTLLSPATPKPQKPIEALAEWISEEGAHRDGKDRQWAPHQKPDWSVKVTESQTRLQRLQRLVKDEGEDLVRLAWTWAITGPDPWWRTQRAGVQLLTSFLIRKNFRHMADAAREWERLGRPSTQEGPGSPQAVGSPFAQMLTWVASRGARGCPRSPEEAQALMGSTWRQHQAALRALKDPNHPNASAVGWVTIAEAQNDYKRSQLARVYDAAFVRGAG